MRLWHFLEARVPKGTAVLVAAILAVGVLAAAPPSTNGEANEINLSQVMFESAGEHVTFTFPNTIEPYSYTIEDVLVDTYLKGGPITTDVLNGLQDNLTFEFSKSAGHVELLIQRTTKPAPVALLVKALDDDGSIVDAFEVRGRFSPGDASVLDVWYVQSESDLVFFWDRTPLDGDVVVSVEGVEVHRGGEPYFATTSVATVTDYAVHASLSDDAQRLFPISDRSSGTDVEEDSHEHPEGDSVAMEGQDEDAMPPQMITRNDPDEVGSTDVGDQLESPFSVGADPVEVGDSGRLVVSLIAVAPFPLSERDEEKVETRGNATTLALHVSYRVTIVKEHTLPGEPPTVLLTERMEDTEEIVAFITAPTSGLAREGAAGTGPPTPALPASGQLSDASAPRRRWYQPWRLPAPPTENLMIGPSPDDTSWTARELAGAPGGRAEPDRPGSIDALHRAMSDLADRMFDGQVEFRDDGSVVATPRGADYRIRYTVDSLADPELRGQRSVGVDFDGTPIVEVTVSDQIPVGWRIGGGLNQRDLWIRRVVVHETAEHAALLESQAEQEALGLAGAPRAHTADALHPDADPNLTRRSPHDEAHRAEVIDLAELLTELRSRTDTDPAAAPLAREVEQQLADLLHALGVAMPGPDTPTAVAHRWQLLDPPPAIAEVIATLPPPGSQVGGQPAGTDPSGLSE
jgi:hypothetical protein